MRQRDQNALNAEPSQYGFACKHRYSYTFTIHSVSTTSVLRYTVLFSVVNSVSIISVLRYTVIIAVINCRCYECTHVCDRVTNSSIQTSDGRQQTNVLRKFPCTGVYKERDAEKDDRRLLNQLSSNSDHLYAY